MRDFFKYLFYYGESRPWQDTRYKVKKRFKSVLEENLKNFDISVKDKKRDAEDMSGWRKLFFDGCQHFYVKCVEHLKLKKTCRKL